ncbi:RsmE family RNA methyltransferase [Vaginella massiliensis]|uniref:RsmE family RNA methyltransferase n=1 Tax=Vaginella massiliensis TaxID=1816680 RepID=UPI0008383C21|nr:RsmE family RNA methyltransferase [Vaginella massiliensis]
MKLFIGEIVEKTAYLNEEESHHFAKVLRGKEGDIVHVTDGEGSLAEIEIYSITKKRVEGKVLNIKREFEKKNYQLHIAIAPTKTIERLEFFLEKATEIGIDEITFLQTFHSERKTIKRERLEKIVQSAAKQSLKAYLPKVNDMVKFNDFIKQNFEEATRCIAHCQTVVTRISYKTLLQSKPNNIVLLIGPEGDFSNEEIALAESNGFTGISLGHQRFRTETAALQAVFATDWSLSD